jgi:hypothetical protein
MTRKIKTKTWLILFASLVIIIFISCKSTKASSSSEDLTKDYQREKRSEKRRLEITKMANDEFEKMEKEKK